MALRIFRGATGQLNLTLQPVVGVWNDREKTLLYLIDKNWSGNCKLSEPFSTRKNIGVLDPWVVCMFFLLLLRLFSNGYLRASPPASAVHRFRQMYRAKP